MISYEGGCLCGAVRYQGTEKKGGGHSDTGNES